MKNFLRGSMATKKKKKNGLNSLQNNKFLDFKSKAFVCLGVYAVSTVFQLFNGDSSRISISSKAFADNKINVT